jgi:hypothetical protein
MTVNTRLGDELSRNLTPVKDDDAPELLPLSEVRDRLLRAHGAMVASVKDLPAAELTAKMAAVDQVEDELRQALLSGEILAYVERDDGRLFRIPDIYWGSFHAFRPLGGEGFCSDYMHDYRDGEHRAKATRFNKQGVFLDKRQADGKWPSAAYSKVKTGDVVEPQIESKKLPGPDGNKRWPDAEQNALNKCKKHGIIAALKWGDKAKIDKWLTDYLSENAGWTPDPRLVARHRKKLLLTLPDNWGDN